MKILVATVLAPGDRTAVWYALQRQFLSRTTDAPFDHGVYLNGVDPVRYGKTVVIGHSRTNDGHAIALARLVDHFRAVKDRYTHFLVLDSDAWPVCPGWHKVLGGMMDRHGKQVAAPVRAENLEPYPHPCAVYCRAEAVDHLRFEMAPFANAYGVEERDVQLTAPAREAVLPLMRSNRVSPHPVFGGVYGHLFYHHGAGSREPVTRSMLAHAFDHYIPPARHAQIEARLYQELLRDPVRLMARLTGTAEPVKC